MSKFVQVGKTFVNLDMVQRIVIEDGPVKNHYADEPKYGNIVFKAGEVLHIYDEASWKRVKRHLGIILDVPTEWIGMDHGDKSFINVTDYYGDDEPVTDVYQELVESLERE